MIKYISEKESNDWDMDISFEELINYNEDCIINTEWNRTKHDNCYTGCCIYLKHPGKDEYEVMLGLNDDGFTYIGDGGFKEGQIVPIEDGLMGLMMNREYQRLLNHNKEHNKLIKKYKKKPVEIEAVLFKRDSFEDIEKFTNGKAKNFRTERTPNGKSYCDIETLEGIHIATEGDYIIKGIKGEFYPCKPDIFEMTYESINQGE